jgi:hypothetical protein
MVVSAPAAFLFYKLSDSLMCDVLSDKKKEGRKKNKLSQISMPQGTACGHLLLPQGTARMHTLIQ